MSPSHSDQIQSAFSEQANAFEDPRFNSVFTDQAQWLFERLGLNADDLLLDVAAGTGHVSRTLAPSVRSAVAIDATEEMLTQGRAQARKAKIENIIFMRGDAAAMPFLDGSFDVVISRFAIHHFQEPEVQVMEMARCVRPGGQIALADILANDDPLIAQTQNHLERLRDPSHTRMLSARELQELAHKAGFEDLFVETRSIDRPLQPWLEQTKTSVRQTEEIIATLQSELGSGPSSGFGPLMRGEEIHFTQTFASLIALKP